MDTVLELFNFIYPVYNNLSALREVKKIEPHLAYVKDHQESYSKQNKPKYLRVAIARFFKHCKILRIIKH